MLTADVEVDMLMERDGFFWSVEIKSAARITAGDTRGIRAFRDTYPSLRHAMGIVIAAVDQSARLPQNIVVMPYDTV